MTRGDMVRPARWAVRATYGVVFALNVACALQFAFVPGAFAGAYQLSGVAGEAAVRGIGVAFLMWNATYPPVIARPDGQRTLGAVVLVQQAIGCVGEAAILFGLPAAGYEVLASSIVRFLAFDAAGLALMGAAFAWMCAARTRSLTPARESARSPRG